MSKQILISEEELHQIIQNQIEKVLCEHANPRKDVIERLKGYFSQLVENWCLIHFCTLTNTDVNQCKKHWKNELWSVLANMYTFKLKGNNTYDARLKVVIESEDYDELLSDSGTTLNIILPKFNIENIDINTNGDVISQVVDDLVSSKEQIIHLIANGDRNEVIEYIDTI